VIEVMSENEGLFNREAPRTLTEADQALRRTYEVAGVSHTDLGFAPEPEPAMVQLAARHHPGGDEDPPCPLDYSDVPMRDFAQAALANLDAWSRTGTPPPPDARLQLAAPGVGAKDEAGNTRGGVRLAQLDLPLASYGPAPDGACKHSGFLVMRRSPLPRATLKALYPGGSAEYLKRFSARLDALVAGRWLLREDVEAEFKRAEAFTARQY